MGGDSDLRAEVVVLRWQLHLDRLSEPGGRDLVGAMTTLFLRITGKVSMRVARSFTRLRNLSLFCCLSRRRILRADRSAHPELMDLGN